ncbi:MAG: ankyrin repeat domain-containing protein [Planctomycetota bacterium]|jgi:ankyrin repeat protein
MEPTQPDPASQFVEACMAGQAGFLRRELALDPELPRSNLFTAAAWGETDAVAAFLDEDPEALTRKGGPSGWEPLLYACFSKAHHLDEDREDPLEETVELLLERGADPNTAWEMKNGTKSFPMPALYGATVAADHPGVAAVLLEGGANPNDGESLFHAAQHLHLECLEVLKAHGADLDGEDTPYGNTPLGFIVDAWDPSLKDTQLEGLRWLLENGADPDVHGGDREETPLHVAARKSPDPDVVRLLLGHGASLDAADRENRTPREVAHLHGRTVIADMLHESGEPALDASTADDLLSACCRGDAGDADALVRSHPSLAAEVPEPDREVLVQMARERNAVAVRLLLQSGLDPGIRGDAGGTALHHAAFLGDLPTVRTVLEHNPPMEQHCHLYDATPLVWAQHASFFMPHPEGAYPAVVDLLLGSGAVPHGRWGSRKVQEVLERRGIEGGPPTTVQG